VTPASIELCVGIIAVDRHRLLVVRRGRPPGQGRWSIPGGHVEPGETMAEAVRRELREETGLDGTCGRLVGWAEHPGRARHLVIFDFEVTVAAAGPLVAGDDAEDARWVPLGEVTALDLVAGLEAFLTEHGILGA
jgi:8-oxo-dGTP diphosphatase